MKRGTPKHPKVDELMDLLNISRALAVGTLELLWHFTAIYAIQGDVGKWSNAQIASACEWDLEPDVLITGLFQAGWLDQSDDYRYLVHDWAVHADQSVKKTLGNRHLDFINGGVPFSFCTCSIQSVVKGSPTSGTGTGTGKAQAQERKGREKRKANAVARIYRVQVGNPGDTTCTASGRGPKNIAKLLKDYDAKDLRQAAINYAESCTILDKEPQFRMFCGNFYGRDATYLGFMPGEYVKPVLETSLDATIAKAHAAGKRAREEMDNV